MYVTISLFTSRLSRSYENNTAMPTEYTTDFTSAASLYNIMIEHLFVYPCLFKKKFKITTLRSCRKSQSYTYTGSHVKCVELHYTVLSETPPHENHPQYNCMYKICSICMSVYYKAICHLHCNFPFEIL